MVASAPSPSLSLPPESFLTLPGGRRLDDAAVVPDFAREFLGVHDLENVWRELRALPTFRGRRPIPLAPDDPVWIPGRHPALRMRGHAIRRSKLWLQRREDFDRGVLLRYRYPGWQWRILRATRAVEALPDAAQNLIERLTAFYASETGLSLNHFIVTRYATGRDGIGFHSDRADDFEPDSHFVVVKLGAPRPFAFRKKGQRHPFFLEHLEPGTGVIVRCRGRRGSDANRRVEHGVPEWARALPDSGSLVARVIRTEIPVAKAEKRIRQSDQLRRLAKAR